MGPKTNIQLISSPQSLLGGRSDELWGFLLSFINGQCLVVTGGRDESVSRNSIFSSLSFIEFGSESFIHQLTADIIATSTVIINYNKQKRRKWFVYICLKPTYF